MLCVSASSVASEQMFSATGEIVTKKRSSMGAKTLRHLTFGYNNTTPADICAVTPAQIKEERKLLVEARAVRLAQQRARQQQASTSAGVASSTEPSAGSAHLPDEAFAYDDALEDPEELRVVGVETIDDLAAWDDIAEGVDDLLGNVSIFHF